MDEKRKEFSRPVFETDALTRAEYIAAITHFYRAELDRANTWRMRLDTTTNWAIVSTIGIFSFAFSSGHPSASIIIGMYLVANFLFLEARRFRYFDVWKDRVRMVEINFYKPLLQRDLVSPTESWGSLVAADLLSPHFKITMKQAIKQRLQRNYLILFIILLAGWIGHFFLFPNATINDPSTDMMPWWIPVGLVIGLYFYLAYILIFTPPIIEPNLELWTRNDSKDIVRDF
jgi:uncharacterized membrane protein